MASESELTVSQPADGVSVIAVRADLDMVTSPALTQLLTQEHEAGTQLLVVDLTGCEFMGSSGLAALVQAQSQAADSGSSLAVAGCGRTVARAITATALDTVLDIYPSVQDAITALHRP